MKTQHKTLMDMLHAMYAMGHGYDERQHKVAALHLLAYLMAGYEGEPVENGFDGEDKPTKKGWYEQCFEEASVIYRDGKVRATFSNSCRGCMFIARLKIGNDTYHSTDNMVGWHKE